MSIDDTSAFVHDLRSRVRAALADGPRSFIDIVRRCDGAYPTLVAEILHGTDFKSRKHDPLIELDTKSVLPSESVLEQLEGNPTLCAWYFTSETCARVAQMRTWNNKRLAFLGAPRLFEWFVRHGVSRECVLFDADVRLLEFLRRTNEYATSQLIPYDVWDGPIKDGSRFDCVFFDPPWYPEVYPQWLARACELAPTGTIVFALFPALTRPSAAREREALLANVHANSGVITVVPAFLEYEIPTFEKAELEAAGLNDVRPWKLADMVILDGAIGSIGLIPKFHSDHWTEVDIGPMRMFVNESCENDDLSQLIARLPDGTVRLRSPSRRDPSRLAANVLSSRGHGASTLRPRDLIEVLQSVAAAYASGMSIEHALSVAAMDNNSKAVLAEIFGGLDG